MARGLPSPPDRPVLSRASLLCSAGPGTASMAGSVVTEVLNPADKEVSGMRIGNVKTGAERFLEFVDH
jgi:hypothetical protein